MAKKAYRRLVKNNLVLADQCLVGVSFFDRLKGLMGRALFRDGEAIWFPRCKSIHMWFMKIPIDVVFVRRLDPVSPITPAKLQVVECVPQLPAWKLFPVNCLSADDAIELPVGTVSRFKIVEGDVLCID